MSLFHSIIIGLVEGVTEFLPISSTAHIIIIQRIFAIPIDESFLIGIQLGALLAVVGIYLREYKTIWRGIPLLIFSFIPTVIAGVFLYPYIHSLHENLTIIATMLFLGGVIMIALPVPKTIESPKIQHQSITWRQGFWIGIAQCFAIVPGVSRSGAIYIASEVMQIPRSVITRFSFLLGAGTIFSASVYSLYKSGQPITILFTPAFSVAFLVSGIAAWISCKWLLDFVARPTAMREFGWYRVILAVVLVCASLFLSL